MKGKRIFLKTRYEEVYIYLGTRLRSTIRAIECISSSPVGLMLLVIYIYIYIGLLRDSFVSNSLFFYCCCYCCYNYYYRVYTDFDIYISICIRAFSYKQMNSVGGCSTKWICYIEYIYIYTFFPPNSFFML